MVQTGNKVMKETKLYIYGAGTRAHALYSLVKKYYDEIIVLDSNEKLAGQIFEDDILINLPKSVLKEENANIVITNINPCNYQEIYNKLVNEYHISPECIVPYEKICWDILQNAPEENITYNRHKNKKIIIDAYTCISLGGIEAWVVDLADGLKKRNYDVRIMADDKKALVNDVNKDYTDFIKRVGSPDATEYIENYRLIKKYIEEQLPCIVVANRGNVVTMAACDVKKRYGDAISVISMIHNGTKDTYQRQAFFSQYVDKYIGVASDMKQGMENEGIDREKIITTTLPFTCKEKLEREYTLNRDNPIQIGYAGRLDGIKNKQKRLDLVMDVIYALHCKNINFHMNFAGDGPARKEMEQLAKERRMQERITFWGKIDRKNIPSFWKKQDIGLSMSDYEGKSISMLEAMANGAVPVYTQVSGTKDEIINEKNGFIIPLGDVKDAAYIITSLERDRNRLVKLGQLAHDSVFPKSSKEKHYELWQNIIAEFEK